VNPPRQRTPHRPPPDPLLASVGLSAWATVVLGALLAAEVVDADDLDGLRARALSEIATAYVTAGASAMPFDAQAVIGRARARQDCAADRRERHRAAA
jgi:hypothetical protein